MEEIIPKNYPTNLLVKDWSKRKCYWHEPAAKFMAKVHDMEIKYDDIWIVTLAKSGTTWMQELVWLVMNDFDFEGAKSEHLELRAPFLENNYYVHKDLSICLKLIEELKSPRIIKSHLPLPLLPAQLWKKQPKLIYVCRNPIDAQISMYYHERNVGRAMDKTLEEYLKDFMENDSFAILPFDHIAEFYALRNEPWVYYTSFERMKSNLSEVILDVCKFLDKNINETQMQQMLKHLSFEEMKKNPKTNLLWTFEQIRKKFNITNYEDNTFVRKGKVNAYKEELSEEFRGIMEQWLKINLAKNSISLNDILLSKNDQKI